ncbi:MAG: YncE family protein [Acidobacteria bacterium]|nr:YncE family protein [Acidobacteriota bacterium]
MSTSWLPPWAAPAALVLALGAVSAGPVRAESDPVPPSRNYYAYVCAESEDEVSLIRFGPSGIEVTKTITVGSFPAEIEGPHGINVSAGGRYWYVSIAHGNPFGSIHKYATGTDEWLGDTTVGMFPATLDIAATTGLLFVVNSDFYGDHVPSTVSVVETSTMTEIAQFESGTMPHGARLSRDGRKLYSVNMMDDELVEVDALRFEVGRRLKLGTQTGIHAAHGDHASHQSAHAGAAVEPSWVTQPTSRGLVYITALSGNALYEVDTAAWNVSRRLETPAAGPYNAAVAPDERLLVVTYKKGDSIGFWDLETGTEVAREDTTRRIPHGVAITSDGRFSLVTVEGIGGEPGVVEVYDNSSYRRVAQIDIGKQAGGIALWEPN